MRFTGTRMMLLIRACEEVMFLSQKINFQPRKSYWFLKGLAKSPRVASHAIDTVDQGSVIIRQSPGPASYRWPSAESGADFLANSQPHVALRRYPACHLPLEGIYFSHASCKPIGASLEHSSQRNRGTYARDREHVAQRFQFKPGSATVKIWLD
jgi:hypothetical protein